MPRINTPESRAQIKADTINRKINRARKYAPVSLDFDALSRELSAINQSATPMSRERGAR